MHTIQRWLRPVTGSLTHKLPAHPSNARVTTWRRLQEIGAVPTRTSVYVLPHTEQCRADFSWLRREIVARGGEAIVFFAEPRDPRESSRLVAAFRRAREDDYRSLSAHARRLGVTRDGRRKTRRSSARERAIRNLRDRFDSVARIDFFQARGRDTVNAAIGALERSLTAGPAEQIGDENGHPAAAFQSRRWVTRPRPLTITRPSLPSSAMRVHIVAETWPRTKRGTKRARMPHAASTGLLTGLLNRSRDRQDARPASITAGPIR